jgi:hypothetical protein
VKKAPKNASEAGPPQPKAPDRWKRAAISAFLLFHLAAIASWSLPFNSLLNDRFKIAVRPYFLWSGLFQDWSMFAPDPSKLNSYIEAEIWYRDGSREMWAFPRMNELGYVDRYFKERYRKFATEYLRLDSNSALWPDAARYLARTHRNPTNPPTGVRLIRSWSEISPPGPGGEFRHTPWAHYPYFTYVVKPVDLE